MITTFGHEPVITKLVCVVVQENVARGARRAGTAVSQYLTSAQLKFLKTWVFVFQ